MRRSFVLAVMLGLAVSGCGGAKEHPASNAPARLRFAVIPKALDIPVFSYAKIGADLHEIDAQVQNALVLAIGALPAGLVAGIGTYLGVRDRLDRCLNGGRGDA